MNARFPKSERLLKRKEFQSVFDEGRTFRNNELLVYALPNGMNKSRLGLVVGKKVGNAVRRNRVKRILREAFRLNKGLLGVGVDLVLIPRPGLTSPALSTIEDGFKRLLTRISAEFVGAGFKPAPTLRD
ncbi:MAG TPA: ribonuclease P protein component [Candidatus Brocadiia bacterium]|nr:ribonuclease P protein component [Planctomycetota bacterium]MDO8094237.1 ribonuclease P protein component [Candidatus Brocadiales bacterium]